MILDLTDKETFLCVEITYGDSIFPTVLRLNDSNDEIKLGNDTFAPEPSLELDTVEQTGSLESKPFSFYLDMESASASELVAMAADLEPSPEINVSFFEVSFSASGDFQKVHLAEGLITSSESEPEDKEGALRCEFVSGKATAKEIRMGIPANPSCGNVFGGAGCLVDTSVYLTPADYFPNNYAGGFAKIRRAYVELRSPYVGARAQEVTLALSASQHPGGTAPTLTTMPRGWWLNGYLVRNGLHIPIRDWWWNLDLDTGTSIFVLGKIPPKSWIYDAGQDNYLTLIPGCSKSASACGARQNQSNWNGLGHAIPAYNPILDDPS